MFYKIKYYILLFFDIGLDFGICSRDFVQNEKSKMKGIIAREGKKEIQDTFIHFEKY